MNLPLFSKLLVSICTVGGGSFGAYVAGFLGSGESEKKVQENNKLVSKDLEEHRSSGTEQSLKTEKDDESKGQATESLGKSEDVNSETQEQATSLESSSISNHPQVPEHSDNLEKTSENPSQNFTFQSKELQEALSSATSDDSEQIDSEETLEEIAEEEEGFERFEEYEGDEEEQQSLEVAEYIKKEEENERGEVLRVSCEDWTLDGIGGIKKKGAGVSGEECEYRRRRDSWGKEGMPQPLVWIDVVQSRAKKILENYGLWKDNVSIFKTNKNKRWTTKSQYKENTGEWDCTRKYSRQKEGNFLIACDFYKSQS
ncbi:hypothetical protein [Mycoplasma suis]|uniref:Uncharacterized protein n=1 Tax=Mycoplasma suis (strain Illinois) TaxID=768700 RepID=F0QQM4_MYCSL|nr:hypothetical protein [Mycoplasma suis]ADX97794.1 hypothetical protein MSU_0250 [Mycoplasma suis str. Illinois]